MREPTVSILAMNCAYSLGLKMPTLTNDFSNCTATKPARASPANGSVP